jgi:UDP-2,3-diacylglucosamine pyrophosphatase LpxH
MTDRTTDGVINGITDGATGTTPTSGDLCYVISDLHIGDGKRLDDFVDDALFAAWVGGLDGPSTTIVMNGDIIDFAQIPPLDIEAGVPSRLLWREWQSLEKLHHAYDAHPVVFDALGDFHGRGGSVRITVGNHDLDLAWPGVQAAIRQRLGATSERVTFAVMSTVFANVWIQHGHQFDKTNSTDDPEHFIHVGPDGHEYLERIWGTDFVLEFFNGIHDKLEFAANLKPQWQLVLQGLKHRWLGWRHFVRVVAFLARRGLPWDAIPDAVLGVDDEPPDLAWLDAYFSDEETALIIRDAIDELGPEAANELGLADLDASLIAGLRTAEAIDIVAAELGPPAPDVADGGTTLGIFRDRAEVRGARSCLSAEIDHVVLGHTHGALDGEEIEPGKKLFNPGTWIPHIDMRNPNVVAARAEHGLTKELLNSREFYRTDIFAIEIRADGSEPTLVSLEAHRPH